MIRVTSAITASTDEASKQCIIIIVCRCGHDHIVSARVGQLWLKCRGQINVMTGKKLFELYVYNRRSAAIDHRQPHHVHIHCIDYIFWANKTTMIKPT